MHKLRTRLAAVAAILLATLVVATASADPGPDSYDGSDAALEVNTPNGGTAAERPPIVEPTGGVSGPPARNRAKSSQLPGFQEEPPVVEPPPEEPAPEEPAPETPPEELPDEEARETPAGTGAGPSGAGGGLPSTGLELAALALVGIGLLLAGLALRRGPA
jgi:hypothetical protein